MKLKEIIVVEGKNDTNVLKSYLECDTIETHGTHIGEAVLRQIRQAKEKRGVIIFTDPDYPGEHIRNTINSRIPGCKNAFIDKTRARTTRKVGVEHAAKEDILEALNHLMTYTDELEETITQEDFLDLGLNGRADSGQRRTHIARKLYLGKANAKTLRKRLNMLQLSCEDVEALFDDYE